MDEPEVEPADESREARRKLMTSIVQPLVVAPLLVLWAWTAARDLFQVLPPMEWWHPWALCLGIRVFFRPLTRD